MLSHEANSSFSKHFSNHHSFLSLFYTNIYMMANAAFIMMSLPIINYGLIPCLPSVSIRARMGAGLGLYTLGSFIVVIIHVCFPDSRSFANHLSLFIPPTVINALAEVMTIVSCKFLFIPTTLLYNYYSLPLLPPPSCTLHISTLSIYPIFYFSIFLCSLIFHGHTS